MSALILIITGSCDSVNDDRIPRLAVNIVLSDAGMWNTYGVAGFGSSRRFILSGAIREPSGFPYNTRSATGYGGVLLVSGMDAFTNETGVALAYDLACPVECKPDIRVHVDPERYEAVCDVCGSHYDVTMGAGAPLSGPAAAGDRKYALRRYQCLPTQTGGYVITN